MTKEEYNRISIVYQFLTKRFDFSQTYQYDGFYRCFDTNHYGVSGENLEVLRHFENLNLRHIYSAEHIASVQYGDNYLNANLLVIEENRVCVHSELGFIFLYILVYKLQDGIKSFIELMYTLKEKYVGLIRTNEDKRIFKMKVYLYDDFIPQFESIENYKFIFHLFAKTNSNYMNRNWSNEVEVDMYKIEKLIKTLKMFNFENVEMQF